MDVGFSKPVVHASKSPVIDREGLLTLERMEEVMMLCARENPVYEQVSSYTVALYALGYFDCPDLMCLRDVDSREAAAILNEHFIEIKKEALPSDYHITASSERYLMVIGDPLFPTHFAALVDSSSPRPYFSKLPLFGSGFDTLEELTGEFTGKEGITGNDVRFFKRTWYGQIPPESRGKIYIIKND